MADFGGSLRIPGSAFHPWRLESIYPVIGLAPRCGLCGAPVLGGASGTVAGLGLCLAPSLFGLVRFSPGSWVLGTRWVATCSWLGLLPLAPVVHLHTHRASAVVASVGGVPVRLTLCISWRASVVARPFRLCAAFSGFVPLFSASRPLSAPKAVAVFSFRASCPFSASVPPFRQACLHLFGLPAFFCTVLCMFRPRSMRVFPAVGEWPLAG